MKRVSDFVVGITVLVIAAIVVGSTLWLNQTDIHERRTKVVARFRDVGNVRVGSAVVIRGVQAGRVREIELTRSGWVRMKLQLDESVTLPEDPVVLLNAASLFGEWQATIMSRQALPQNPELRRQIAEASGDGHDIPGAMVPDIAQLTMVAGGIAGNVASVAERFKTAFDDRAAVELRTSISNVAALSAELQRTVRKQSGNLDRIAGDVHGGVQQLLTTAESFRRVAERMDSSTSTGEVRAIVRDLARAASQLETTSAQVRDLSIRLNASQQHLDGLLARSDSVMMKVNAGQGSLGLLVNDPSLYRRSDSLVASLQALLSDWKANPKKYVSVRLF